MLLSLLYKRRKLRPQKQQQGRFWPLLGTHTELDIGLSPLTPAASPASLSRQGRKQPLGPKLCKGGSKWRLRGKPRPWAGHREAGRAAWTSDPGSQPEAAGCAGRMTNTHTHTCTHTHTFTQMHTHIQIYILTQIPIHMHTPTYLHTHSQICILTQMHTYTLTHTHSHSHTRTHTLMYTHIKCTFKYTHLHTHTGGCGQQGLIELKACEISNCRSEGLEGAGSTFSCETGSHVTQTGLKFTMLPSTILNFQSSTS